MRINEKFHAGARVLMTSSTVFQPLPLLIAVSRVPCNMVEMWCPGHKDIFRDFRHSFRFRHLIFLFLVNSNMVNRDSINKKGFRPLLGLISWWKGRRFYFAQQEEYEEEDGEDSASSEGKDGRGRGPEQASRSTSDPNSTLFQRSTTQEQLHFHLVRTLTIDSFQDSIESMDSLTGSYWDPADETSQTTTPASNTGYQTDFLVEHLGFLSAQTQPREVEVVYRS